MAADGTLMPVVRAGYVLTGDAWAGAEAQVWQLVDRVRRYGVEPSVATLHAGAVADRFRGLGVPVAELGGAGSSWRRLRAALADWLATHRFDAVHVHKYKEHVLTAQARGAARVPALVRTVHGAREPRGGLKARTVRWLEDRAMRRRTDAVIAVSDDLARHIGPRVAGTRVAVIANGVSADGVVEQPAEATAPVLLYCGRLMAVKAVGRLIHALALVRVSVPDAELWIAGEGVEEAPLRETAAAARVADAVKFLGFRRDVPRLLRDARAVVLSSEHEGMPMIVLEAGAAGRPVVAPRVGGLPEVIVDGETGVLTAEATPEALADACVPLLRDPAEAARLGRAAHARIVERFSANATARATAQLYREVLGMAEASARADVPAAEVVCGAG